jgi:hypothetical protein
MPINTASISPNGQALVKTSSANLKAKKAEVKPNKSDFIRQHPGLKTAELVALGAKQGIKFSPALVYMVRVGPSKSAAKRIHPATSTPPRATPASKNASLSADQKELARAILNVGFAEAEAVFDRVRALVG